MLFSLLATNANAQLIWRQNSVEQKVQGIDDQKDIEEIGFEKLSYNQSAHDSAESNATPPDSKLEDEQLRMMLASPLYTKVSGKPDAVFPYHGESSQKHVV